MMKKLLLLVSLLFLLMLACGSPTDNAEKYYEPVEERYLSIEVPVVADENLL